MCSYGTVGEGDPGYRLRSNEGTTINLQVKIPADPVAEVPGLGITAVHFVDNPRCVTMAIIIGTPIGLKFIREQGKNAFSGWNYNKL